MPTHTPSPHRFLAPSASHSQRPKPKPSSTLRHGVTAQTPREKATVKEETSIPSRKATPAKRFVVTPHRRTLSSENQARSNPNFDGALVTQNAQLTPRPRSTRHFERVESIEEPHSSPLGFIHPDQGSGVAPSVEHCNDNDGDDGDDNEQMLFASSHANKRRRLSTPTSPTPTHHSEPTTPTTIHNTSIHRFLVPPTPAPGPFSTSNIIGTPGPGTVASASHRPHFILPPQPTSPPKPNKPLPEIFSPSRKNGRYIANGLASTVQSWIIETANTGFAAQDRGAVWGQHKEDGVKLKVHISDVADGSSKGNQNEVECFSGGFVFVQGASRPGLYNVSRAPDALGDHGEMRILLAGQGGSRGTGTIMVRKGSVLGIREPMWEVEVSGSKWLMGVDWVVLS